MTQMWGMKLCCSEWIGVTTCFSHWIKIKRFLQATEEWKDTKTAINSPRGTNQADVQQALTEP